MSLLTWNRLEPMVDASSTGPGLAAKVADPLWLLGRQWQFGELTAEDAGTPISVAIDSMSYPIDRLRVDSHERSLDGGTPLEALVEAEPPAAPDLRMRARGGRYLHDLLAAVSADAVSGAAREFPFVVPEDRAGAAFVRGLGPAPIDGAMAFEAVARDGAAAIAARLVSAAANPVADVLRRWAAWFAGRIGREAPSAWVAQQAAYRFELAAAVDDHDVVLEAASYRGGRLDWSDLQARRETQAANATVAPSARSEVVLPVPVRFAGAPVARFFEFENRTVRFGSVAGGPADVATALFVEIALIYGNDWFVAPVTTPVCSVSRIDRVVITDTFGMTSTRRSRVRSPGWRMYEASDADGIRDLLIVLPTVTLPIDGPPIEEIAIARDEIANVAWAIERVTADPLGLPVQQSPPPYVAPSPGTIALYQPMITPPDTWFPLVRRERSLVGAGLRAVEHVASPRGHLLAAWPLVAVAAHEVPRDGVLLTRRWQLAPVRTGGHRLWLSRSASPGVGEVSSGVLVDQLLMPT